MEDLYGLLFGLGFLLFFLGLGLFVGKAVERAHFRSLEQRESECGDFVVTQLASFPGIASDGPTPAAFFAEAVVASDYLKNFLAGFRNLLGGEVLSYTSMLERARREALLRIIDQAREAGYNAVCNVRFETADIAGANVAAGKRRAAVMAPIMASATAYHRR